MSAPMTHEYVHGYYLEELKLQLEAMKAKFETQQEKKQAIIDGLTTASDAYFTTADLLTNRREKQIRNTEIKHGVDISAPDSKGKDWDVDEPSSKLGKFKEKVLQKVFGVSPKIKALENESGDDSYLSLDEVRANNQPAIKQLENIKSDVQTEDPYPSSAYVDEDSMGNKISVPQSTLDFEYEQGAVSEAGESERLDAEYEQGAVSEEILDKSRKTSETRRDREMGLTQDKITYGAVAGPHSLLATSGDYKYGLRKKESDRKLKEWQDEQRRKIEEEKNKGKNKEEIFTGLSDSDKSGAKMAINNSFKDLLEKDKKKRNLGLTKTQTTLLS